MFGVLKYTVNTRRIPTVLVVPGRHRLRRAASTPQACHLGADVSPMVADVSPLSNYLYFSLCLL
jgi:hypothetical protein